MPRHEALLAFLRRLDPLEEQPLLDIARRLASNGPCSYEQLIGPLDRARELFRELPVDAPQKECARAAALAAGLKWAFLLSTLLPSERYDKQVYQAAESAWAQLGLIV